MRNGNFLKIPVSEIGVKQIRVNQGLDIFVLKFHGLIKENFLPRLFPQKNCQIIDIA